VEESEDGLAKEHLVDLEVAEEASHHTQEEQAPLDRVTMVETLIKVAGAEVAEVPEPQGKLVLQAVQAVQDWLLQLLDPV
jgi:predicted GTPase